MALISSFFFDEFLTQDTTLLYLQKSCIGQRPRRWRLYKTDAAVSW